MTRHAIVLSRPVAATPERVWTILTDVPRAADTLRGVDSVEMLTEPPYIVGTRWRETRTMFGKKATEELRVTTAEAPHRTVVEAESSGTHYTTTFTVVPDGAGSILGMEFAGELVSSSAWYRFLWKAFGKAGMRAVSKAMRADLDDIATAAEKVH